MTSELIIPLIIAVLGSSIISTLITTLSGRKKSEAETGKTTVESSNSVVFAQDVAIENLQSDNEKIRSRYQEIENKYDKILIAYNDLSSEFEKVKKEIKNMHNSNIELEKVKDQLISENKELKDNLLEMRNLTLEQKSVIDQLTNKLGDFLEEVEDKHFTSN
jgi:chromosome segregation ATPase